jgi:hypothetical protein
MNLHPFTRAGYVGQRYPTIKALEGLVMRPYNDGVGNITIGIGFNLRDADVRAQVLAKLGFTDPRLVSELDTYLDAPHLHVDDATIQGTLDGIVQKYIPGGSFGFSSETQVKELFDGTGAVGSGLAQKFEKIVDSWARVHGIYPSGVMPDSQERTVLLSLAYNGVLNKSGKLADDIKANNRAEAWFELRYDTNPVAQKYSQGVALTGSLADQFTHGIDKGIAKRRDYESTLFGLYDPGTVTLAEADSVYKMLGQHRTDILRYEMHYGDDAHSTTPDRGNQISQAVSSYTGFTGAVVTLSLQDSLNSARDTILSDLHTRFAADETAFGSPLFNDQWLSTDIYVADPGGSVLDASAVEQIGGVYANGSADLMVGSASATNTLEGRKGNDTLVGGDQVDTLEGGAGDDLLIGGAGKDVYIWSTGDGNDTIVDADGGVMIFNGAGYNFAGGTMVKDASGDTWHDSTGNVALTHSTAWSITLSDGSVIQLGASFDPSKWGITLADPVVSRIRSDVLRLRRSGSS